MAPIEQPEAEVQAPPAAGPEQTDAERELAAALDAGGGNVEDAGVLPKGVDARPENERGTDEGAQASAGDESRRGDA